MPMVAVLVNGAHMPKVREPPESLKDFSFRNAAEVDSGRDFRQHMDRLIRAIDKTLDLKPRVPGERPYLNKYGISVDNMVPPESEIVLGNKRSLYEGGGILPSTSQIFLTQTNTGNVPAAYTLTFSKPVDHMSFTRRSLYAATSSGVTHPAGKATALGANGEELASQSETLLRKIKMKGPGDDTVPARTYSLASVTFQGISAVRFDSDPRLNGKPFAGFSTLLIERVTFGGSR
jgi:hypothetical protein